MRLNTPRIPPLQESEWNEKQRQLLSPYAEKGRLYNIYKTLGRIPAAFEAFIAWGSYVLRQASLPARERELVILRVGYLCKAGYEWAQHTRLGKQVGLTDAEINRIKNIMIAKEWGEQDQTLLLATDELHRDYFISNSTWAALREFLSDEQCMDLVYTVGHYTQVCMVLNTFGVQLDKDLEGDAELMQK